MPNKDDIVQRVNEWWEKRKRKGHVKTRALKLRYLEETTECYWCGIQVIDFIQLDHQLAPPNMATIDHLKSRFFRERGEVTVKVLACNACNQRRAREENKEMNRDHQKKMYEKNKKSA